MWFLSTKLAGTDFRGLVSTRRAWGATLMGQGRQASRYRASIAAQRCSVLQSLSYCLCQLLPVLLRHALTYQGGPRPTSRRAICTLTLHYCSKKACGALLTPIDCSWESRVSTSTVSPASLCSLLTPSCKEAGETVLVLCAGPRKDRGKHCWAAQRGERTRAYKPSTIEYRGANSVLQCDTL